MTVNVLFVCMGNICRSPTAHGVFENMVKKAGFKKQIQVDSAGTGAWHVDAAPDKRAIRAAADRGYKLNHLRARLLTAEDFASFDYILGMDLENMEGIQQLQPSTYPGVSDLFLTFAQGAEYTEVPDPYYGGASGFELVLDLVEAGASGLLQHIRQQDLRS